MSSSLEERSPKSHDNPDQTNKDVDYNFRPDNQLSYQGGMPPNSQNYFYWPYSNNPTPQDSGWQNRDGMYAGYPSDYLYNQFDPNQFYYYQNMDPSAWNQQQQQLSNSYYKGNRDYNNGLFYGMQSNNNGSDDAYGINGVLHSTEQSFKAMNINRQEEEKDNRMSSMPSGKKSWANVVTQPSIKSLSRSKIIPKPPLSFSKSAGESIFDRNRSFHARASTGEGRQVPVGPYAISNNRYPTAPSLGYKMEAGGDLSSVQKAQTLRNDEGFNGNISEYNPKDFDLNPKGARFFVIKSFSEDDIHRSIKYSIWCSTEFGNKRLDTAYREREGKGQVFLFYSVNGSGHFCGVALMTSSVDYNSSAEVWAQDKWKGQFSVKWLYVKDVPNSQLRHIRLENNDNKPVTNSRDTQEIPYEKGKQVLRIIHQYRHTTSIFDDFSHYEKQQSEIEQQKRH